MKKRTAVACLALGLLCSQAARPQSTHSSKRPAAARWPSSALQVNQETDPGTPRLDLLKLQKEADDLARAAQSIPSDVESVRKGMLPKDVIQKLRQIEKLSKHLRSELNP